MANGKVARVIRSVSDGWVIERLEEWGTAMMVGSGYLSLGWGGSCLNISEVRSSNAFSHVPELPGKAQETDLAVKKQPRDLQRVAELLYAVRLSGREAAEELSTSETMVTRRKQMLLAGVKYCLENQNVRTPPLRVILKS
ncbi:hypothetical protein [Cupriavidus sp. YAF13]|uniref:hypothetical protein n=1 Tax=Cupriavidus sp. YAF13 TaxID=3233075 RepID=UPI003F92CCC0